LTLVRLCPRCGVQMPYPGRGQCRDCRRITERERGTRQRRGYTDQWLKLSRLAIAAHPFCSVSGCEETTDLTADHIVPKSKGGKNELENVQVLCRKHNSSKRDRGFLRGAAPNPETRFREKNTQSRNSNQVNLG
jgi:5-methylcytosine-specific restriction endonuclease McrA